MPTDRRLCSTTAEHAEETPDAVDVVLVLAAEHCSRPGSDGSSGGGALPFPVVVSCLPRLRPSQLVFVLRLGVLSVLALLLVLVLLPRRRVLLLPRCSLALGPLWRWSALDGDGRHQMALVGVGWRWLAAITCSRSRRRASASSRRCASAACRSKRMSSARRSSSCLRTCPRAGWISVLLLERLRRQCSHSGRG